MILGALFSPCRQYRYTLNRVWNEKGARLMWILLNPSTADESRDDPTIRRCIGYSMNAGYGGMVLMNLFAWRSTWPLTLLEVPDPVGPENDGLTGVYSQAGYDVVCAWGNVHKGLASRPPAVLRILRDAGAAVYYLRLTAAGNPAHPLYLPSQLRPIRWLCAERDRQLV